MKDGITYAHYINTGHGPLQERLALLIQNYFRDFGYYPDVCYINKKFVNEKVSLGIDLKIKPWPHPAQDIILGNEKKTRLDTEIEKSTSDPQSSNVGPAGVELQPPQPLQGRLV